MNDPVAVQHQPLAPVAIEKGFLALVVNAHWIAKTVKVLHLDSDSYLWQFAIDWEQVFFHPVLTLIRKLLVLMVFQPSLEEHEKQHDLT
jgi:hypothetical protein